LNKNIIKKFLHFAIIVVISLWFTKIVIGQQVITTTTTKITTIPGTTFTTIIKQPDTTILLTMIMPGYKIIIEHEEPEQVCIETIKALPGFTISIQGTTFTIPGTTFSTIISIPTYATTIFETIGGKVITTTDVATIEFKTEIPGITTMTMPFPIYGEIIRSCNKVTVKEVMIYIADKVPATIFVAMPGGTYTVPGMTMTMEMPIQTTVVQTKTLEGTTYKTTESFSGTTEHISSVIKGTTLTNIIAEPGTTKTEIVIITTTLPTKTPATPSTTTTEVTTPKTPTTTPTTITPTTVAPTGLDVMTLGIMAGVIVIVIILVIYLVMRKRR
jgi:hypothetical protein